MQRKLPGIDIPAATEAKILHAAAFLEFKQHVERLARVGSDLQAYTCWMHGVEVCHSPYVMATGTDSDFFSPLCRRCPVALMTASVAQPTLWRVQVPLARIVEQPRCRAARRCGSQQSLGLLLSAPGPYGPVAGGGLHELQGCIRHGSPGALCASMRFNSDAQRVTLGSWVWGNSSTSGADGSGVWAAERSCQPSSAFPSGSQGATLSLGTRRSTRTSGALWLAGGAELRHTSAWDGLR